MALSPPPLALYLHFPWCVRKCPYCDFNSHAVQEQAPVEAYLSALYADLEIQAPGVAGRSVVSLFIGGGTPSLMPPEAVARLLETTRKLLDLSACSEVTLEANPGTIERGRFAEYRAAGINRVSLGAQSFQPQLLAALGRIHSADETRRAATELHAAGLDNFNLDLMVGLPGQDSDQALADVRAALALEPAHLSHYQLTLEPGTVFGGRPPEGLPTHDTAADMQERCQELLATAGFAQYEVAAFARDGRLCTHNLNYWQFGDYLGVGAGAHGKLTDPSTGLIRRTTREREPRRYMARGAAGLPPSRDVPVSDLPFEFMMNALRLTDGFTTTLFEARTGLAWDAVVEPVGRLTQRGLLTTDGSACRPTSLGRQFLNEMLMEFMTPPAVEGSPQGVKTSARPTT